VCAAVRASTKQTMQWARTVDRAKQEHRAERNDDELVHLEQNFPCECER
jgi:hypothetical protein